MPLTASYSRDVDGSGFFYKGRMYSGVESGWFYKLDPFKTGGWNGYQTPDIIAERLLLGDPGDASAHGGNLVLEASPSLLDDVIYVCSGSGHVYGMRRSDLKVVWDYRTGSDLDGTPVPTSAGKLLVAVEKQYISGHGGILMLDPSKDPADSVVWFFPTGDRTVGDWEGGVVGSVAVNDTYDPWGRRPRLAAFIAIDGNLYVVSQNKTSGEGPGPNGDGPYPTPQGRRRVRHRRRHRLADHGGRQHRRRRLRQQGPPLRDQVQEGRQGRRGSSKEPQRHLVQGDREGEGLVRRRRRLREHPRDVERQGLHRLARRLALLPRRRLTPSLTARDRLTVCGV